MKRNGRKVTTLGPGAVMGELSLLDHGPRTATVTCDTDCSLLVIDQRHFLGVIDEVPSIAAKLLADAGGPYPRPRPHVLRLTSRAHSLASLASLAPFDRVEF